MGTKNPVDIYAETRVQEAIKRIFNHVFASFKYPGIPKMKLHPVSGRTFKIDEVKFTPVRCFHHKLPVYGFRVGNLTYITDTNYIPPEELGKVKGTKVLIINALQKEKHISHFNLEEAFLTHLSHAFGKHDDIEDDIEKVLPNNVFVAYDGLKITIEY